MKTWGALFLVGLFCGPAAALADTRAPEAPDLIGLLLDDPIGFALERAAAAPAEPEAAESVEGGVLVVIDAPSEPIAPPTELAARAFDITYTFAYPDSVRRAGADR